MQAFEAEQTDAPSRNLELERKLRRMTILVGMVGSDGIVLAADQCTASLGLTETTIDDQQDICKIVNLEKHQVAYARVGDHVSKEVGRKLSRELDLGDFDFNTIDLCLEGIAAETISTESEKTGKGFDTNLIRSLLVVFYGARVPEPQLWRVSISPPYPSTEEIKKIAISGADGNLARFLGSYYRRESSRLPVRSLAFLASHIVLTAGRFDPRMIGGLDVALFENGQCKFLSEQAIDDLTIRSRGLDKLIRSELFKT
jgi:hypothetical protein